MNTNQLKKFAQEARIKIVSQVAAKLDYVLTTDSAVLREKEVQVKKLKAEIQKNSKEQVVDKVAYTWFNRLMALRFMDANDYQPIKIGVVTPKDGYTLPELLDEAKQGNIPDELPVDAKHIFELLDGTIRSSDAQNEAYKELLIGACNHLNTIFPFLFEKINDYAELLLPDDLTSEFSIVQDVRDGMATEDCAEVEIIGWLYQFYISERKDELINAKKRYKADEIAPVTQLFTPKWIVQYMVDNTLGQFWKEASLNTKITEDLEFYIKPNNPDLIPTRDLKSIEDITFFDPCVGSAHVLCYAFDIFYRMYEEQGYNPSEIAENIITKNLYGIDIDDRAAQLAGFALMMKGRKKHRRFFRKKVIPSITAFQNIESHPKFDNAKVLGSLIKISKEEVDEIKVDETSLFVDRDTQLQKQATLLGNKYDIVVTNPPYLNSSYMNKSLKDFVEREYQSTKSDLFACFLIQVSNFTKENGLIGFICPYVWMFIKSYFKLRSDILKTTTISSLIQLEYNAFGPAVVPICSFVLRNQSIFDSKGTYIKLSEFKGIENQEPKTLAAIKNRQLPYIFNVSQNNFLKIEGSPISFWANNKAYEHFEKTISISEVADLKTGITTGDNDKFTRFWFEVSSESINLFNENSDFSWVPLKCGGGFRKWFGNNDTVIYWKNNGEDIKNFADEKTGRKKSTIRNKQFYFKESITWSKITNYRLSVRYTPEGYLFDAVGLSGFSDKINIRYLQALLNSNVANYFAKLLNESMSILVGDLVKIPYLESETEKVIRLTNDCIKIAKWDWDKYEVSMELSQNPLVKLLVNNLLEESVETYKQFCENKFQRVLENESSINKVLNSVYGLNNLSIKPKLKDITILKEETDIVDGELVFDAKEVLVQFISYAVGCMFGRYSLDKEGLILANQGETLEDYLNKLATNNQQLAASFMPDDDNIIPILDDEWFEDDIVGRFYEFLKVTFGESQFEKNLAFVEDCIGKNIRKFFVKDFYNDHIKRYKKRPIYWMFSSPKGAFNVLVYMHRYTPDTLNQILNGYLVEYREKLNTRMEHLDHLIESGTSSEQTKAAKEKDRLKAVLLELQEYEREVLYPLATERIAIDLDDGVLVNYNKFGNAIKEVKGLNDKKKKADVMKFDWIDTTLIK